MCFTIEVHTSRKAIETRFSVDTRALKDFDFKYFYRAFDNPLIPVITENSPERARLLQWGLIPSWARDLNHAHLIRKGNYNARAESLHEKPSFQKALQKGRCLILSHGFFEWQHLSGAKIPWYIRLKDKNLFAFAGLYESWKDPHSGEILNTCSIITTQANPLMKIIHNSKYRMPVILPEKNERDWISGGPVREKAEQLLLPLDQKLMHAHTIGTGISGKGVDPGDPDLIKPVDYPLNGSLF